LFVVVPEEAVDPGAQLPRALVAAQVDVLVLDGAPEPLDEDVVHPASAPVHADSDLRVEQDVDEGVAGELRALVGVEDLWLAVAVHGLLQRLAAEVGGEAVGQLPGKHPAPMPVHHRHQVHEALRQRYVRDVGAPHLVGAPHVQVPQ